jgi:hypothetical protein
MNLETPGITSTVTIEGPKVHFLHENSAKKDAIHLLLLGKDVSYHVVVPSLPGFAFSSAPPADWTVDDTGRILNALMTDVLGYSTCAVHSTDWVIKAHNNVLTFRVALLVIRCTHRTIRRSALLILASSLSFPPPKKSVQRSVEWARTGLGYSNEQTTKV